MAATSQGRSNASKGSKDGSNRTPIPNYIRPNGKPSSPFKPLPNNVGPRGQRPSYKPANTRKSGRGK